jgi:hypothetical protein
VLEVDGAPGCAPELVQRQLAIATLGHAHALLALAAEVGLSADLGVIEEQAWRGRCNEPAGPRGDLNAQTRYRTNVPRPGTVWTRPSSTRTAMPLRIVPTLG